MIWILFTAIQALAEHHLQSPPNPIRTYDFVAQPLIYRHTTDLLSFSFQVSFVNQTFNETFHVDLTPNQDFRVQGAIVEIQTGENTLTMPLSTKHVYKGTVKSNGKTVKDSWARIVVSDEDAVQLEGTISTNSGLFHIKTIKQYKKAKRDVFYCNKVDVEIASPFSRNVNARHSKLIALREEHPDKIMHSCTSDKCDLLKKRDGLEISTCGVVTNKGFGMQYLKSLETISKAAAGCPVTKKLLLMGVAADCSYVAEKGSRSEALNAILTNWNIVSKVYESSFNVQLGVAKVVIQESCTPTDAATPWNADCSRSAYTISDRLSDFSRWRGTQQDSFGLWHLLTKCSTQPAVGIAWLGMLCSQNTISQNGQFVSGTGVSAIVPVEWKVIAHEIGHNFGAIHDCTASICGNDCTACNPGCDCKSQFLMNPLDTSITDQFSPGSTDRICTGISRQGSCLVDPGSATLVAQGICGNGVKEGNEQCDCGLPADCPNDPCCDAATCRLKPNAQCSDKNDQCCSPTCQILPSTVVCHQSNGVCDTTVNCPGTNATCPINTFVADGTTCQTTTGISAQCSSGICTSRDLQCKGSGIISTVSACPAFGNDCAMNCQDAKGICYSLNGFFLDGTTCGGTGKCRKGKCEGTNIISMGLLWLNTFPQYGYPILAIVGLLLLSMIWGCIRNCCCKRKTPTRNANRPASGNRNPISGNGRQNNRGRAQPTQAFVGDTFPPQQKVIVSRP